MNKLLLVYANILEEYLFEVFENNLIIDPIELNRERFATRVAFISVIFFLSTNKINKKSNIINLTNDWLKLNFDKNNLFSSILNNLNDKLANLITSKLHNTIDIMDNIEISTLYENILGIETGNIDIKSTKNYRNKLGSYYTPLDLARKVTSKTIDEYLKLNLDISLAESIIKYKDELILHIPTIKFADFSCGGGAFLIEIINYFDNLFTKLEIEDDIKEKLLLEISLNIYAYDVDCVALEIAKLNLLSRIKKPFLYHSLENNFIHGNFLLHNDFDNINPISKFSEGYIYHKDLSLNKKYLYKYDVILGNPPWEKIRFEEKNFYSMYLNKIKDKNFKINITNEIKESEILNISLLRFAKNYKDEIENNKRKIKENEFFKLSNNGELSTYLLFTNAALNLRTERGVIGLVLKSGVLTSQIHKKLFQYIVSNNLVISIYDFINKNKIFNIDSRERFCFLLLGKSTNKYFKVLMNLTNIDEINDSGIKFTFSELEQLNPLTKMLPNFSSNEEISFLLRVSKNFPIFNAVFSRVKFGRIVHFTTHIEYISKKKMDTNIPIYEGKFINQYDGKFSGFNEIENDFRYGSKSKSKILIENRKSEKEYIPESRFFIDKEKWKNLSKNYNAEYMLAWRSLTSATNTRTSIATILPFIPASQSIQFLITDNNKLLYLAGLFNSVVFDFILKKKLSGIDLTQSLINQMPIPMCSILEKSIELDGKIRTILMHINLLVYSILKVDYRLKKLFSELNIDNEQISNKSKFEIIRDIDLIFMLLYDIKSSELELVLSSFPKMYSADDLIWFNNQINRLNTNLYE